MIGFNYTENGLIVWRRVINLDGWVKLHRKIIDSDIYQMPPLYLRVFLRLVIEANHQDNEIPYKEHGQNITGKKLIKRGERLTSVRDICKWVAWYERGKLKEPNPKTVQEILDWLENNNMIEIYGVKGNRKETHYKIVNYDIYQDIDSDKVTEKKQQSNSKTTEKKQSLDTNKNDKNEKNNISKDIYSDDPDLNKAILDFIEFRKKIKAPMTPRAIELLKNNLNKLSQDKQTQIKIINQSIMNGWKGVFPLKEDISQPKQIKYNQYQQRSYSEQDMAELEKRLLRGN